MVPVPCPAHIFQRGIKCRETDQDQNRRRQKPEDNRDNQGLQGLRLGRSFEQERRHAHDRGGDGNEDRTEP